METIISEKHFFKFYITIFLFVLFFGLLSFVTGALYYQASNLFGEIVMIIMSALLGFMAFYTIFRYYKSTPRVIVDEHSITLDSKNFYWKDLEKVEMTGKWPFRFMWEQKEGMLLKFKGEKERFIFDDMYENSPEIKSFVQAVVNKMTPNMTNTNISVLETRSPNHDKPESLAESTTDTAAIITFEKEQDSVRWFKGFPLYSLDCIMFGGLTLFFLSIGVFDFFRNYGTSAIAGPVLLSFFIFLLICNRWHYFGISNNFLLVNSYFFFWIKNEYGLADIKEIVFEETGGRSSTTQMRIIMKDFSTVKFTAATLWNKTWLQLKTELENKGIEVRNDSLLLV